MTWGAALPWLLAPGRSLDLSTGPVRDDPDHRWGYGTTPARYGSYRPSLLYRCSCPPSRRPSSGSLQQGDPMHIAWAAMLLTWSARRPPSARSPGARNRSLDRGAACCGSRTPPWWRTCAGPATTCALRPNGPRRAHSPSRASWPRPAMICASRSTPSACSSARCSGTACRRRPIPGPGRPDRQLRWRRWTAWFGSLLDISQLDAGAPSRAAPSRRHRRPAAARPDLPRSGRRGRSAKGSA